MKMLQAVVSLAAMAMMINLSMASNYTVGAPNGGWDQSTDLTTWASSQTFLVGDNLIFQYTTNHDVTEVSKPDFDSCSASNPLQPPHSGGLTLIPLTSAGTRYFICGSAGHCLGGMKVQIDILAASSPPPSTTPSLPPPPPPATPPPSITPSIPPPPPATPPTAPSPPSTTPSVPTPSPRTAPSSPSPPPTPSVGRPVSSPPPKSIAPAPSPKHSHGPAPAPSPYHPHSPAPKVSPSSAPPTAAASNPALPPSAAAPSPIGSLPPPPAPSSAAKFTVKGALTAASSGFLMMMFLNL